MSETTIDDVIDFLKTETNYADIVDDVTSRESLSDAVRMIEEMINEGSIYSLTSESNDIDDTIFILQKTYNRLPEEYRSFFIPIKRSEDAAFFPRSRFVGCFVTDVENNNEFVELYPMWCCTLGSYARENINITQAKYFFLAYLFPVVVITRCDTDNRVCFYWWAGYYPRRSRISKE